MYYYIVAILFVIFMFYIPLPMLFKIIIRTLFIKRMKQTNCIFLTFDDGPNIESTPKILKILKKEGIKATFFLLSKNIEKYPKIVNDILSDGHGIGEHGYSHLHPWKSNPISYINDLIKSNAVIKRYVRSDVRVVFRPPYGKFNLITILYILFKKRSVAFWDIDPRDYNATSPEEVFLILSKQIGKGSVVLLHDGRLNPLSSNVKVTLTALKIFLNSKKADESVCFTTIDKIINSSH